MLGRGCKGGGVRKGVLGMGGVIGSGCEGGGVRDGGVRKGVC